MLSPPFPLSDLPPTLLTRRATIGEPLYGDNHTHHRRQHHPDHIEALNSEGTRNLHADEHHHHPPGRKAAIIACERCRRRKIRCDGAQPCATCARFGVHCVRVDERRRSRSGRRGEHAALAERVRMLEARLAAVGGGGGGVEGLFPMGVEIEMGDISPSASSSLSVSSASARMNGEARRNAQMSLPPSLHVETTFERGPESFLLPPCASPASSFCGEDGDRDGQSFHLHDELPWSNIPIIQVTGPQGDEDDDDMWPERLSFSPSPSLFSGTSRASSPDPFAVATSFDLHLGSPPSTSSTALTPFSSANFPSATLSQWDKVLDEYNTTLIPYTPLSPPNRLSRASSFPSLDVFPDENNHHNHDNHNYTLDFTTPTLPTTNTTTRITQAPHSLHSAHMMAKTPEMPKFQERLPPKPHAEILAHHAFATSTTHHPLPLEPTAFRLCFEAVYAQDDGPSPATTNPHPPAAAAAPPLRPSATNAKPPATSTLLPDEARKMLTTYTPYSLRMARCLVGLVVAIGSRVGLHAGSVGTLEALGVGRGGKYSEEEAEEEEKRRRRRKKRNYSLLTTTEQRESSDCCNCTCTYTYTCTCSRNRYYRSGYAVAARQMREVEMWEEAGAREVIGLLGILAQLASPSPSSPSPSPSPSPSSSSSFSPFSISHS